jgi:acyl-coenzyme A synthetase/AMP-(fatty) acid ligase
VESIDGRYNIANSITAWAQKSPDAPAVLTPEGMLTFAELDRAVAWTAANFHRAGLEPGAVVGVTLTDGVQQIVTSLALLRLGAGQISLPATEPPRVQRQLAERLDILAVVADGAATPTVSAPLIQAPPQDPGAYRGLDPSGVPAVVAGDVPCFYTKTSGTTGIPKIGLLTQVLAYNRVRDRHHTMPRGPGTRYLSMPNLSFLAAMYDALSCLMYGGCLAMVDGRAKMTTLVEFALKHRINFIFGVPVHAQALLNVAKEGRRLLPDLNAFHTGTTMIPELLRERIRETLTPNLYVVLGTSENGHVTVAPPDLIGIISGVVGYPFPDVKVEAIDDDGRTLPPGQRGKLRVRSPSTIDGYLNDDEESARSFRDGWFYSGDLGELTEEGALIHFGRADDIMIFNGMNIYPVEIENALLQHPAIQDAAAFAVKHPTMGDQPAAAFVAKAPVTYKDLRAHCREWLGIKSPGGFIKLDALPRTPSGKLLRRKLAAQYLDLLAKKQGAERS